MALRPVWSYRPFPVSSFITQRIQGTLGSLPFAGDNEVAPGSDEENEVRIFETQILRHNAFLRDIITFVCSQDQELDQSIRDKLKYIWSSSFRSVDFREDIGYYVRTLLLIHRRREEFLKSESDQEDNRFPLRTKQYRQYLVSGSPRDFCIFLAGVCKVFSSGVVSDFLTSRLHFVIKEAVVLIRSCSPKFPDYDEIHMFTNRRFMDEITKYSDLSRDIFQLVPEDDSSDDEGLDGTESPQMEDAAARNVQAVTGECSTSSNDEISWGSSPLTQKPTAGKCSLVIETDSLTPILRFRLFLKSVILYVCSLDRTLIVTSKERVKKLKQSSARSSDFTDNIGNHVLSLVSTFRQLEELKGSTLFSLKLEGPMIQRINCRLRHDMEFAASGSPEDFCSFLACVCKFCSSLAAEGQLENYLTTVTVIAASLMHSYLEQFEGYEELDRYACNRVLGNT